ncbi:hypothetical protein PYCCODRAFT_1427889 [Trametes coccinea BRFM310]|uniref:Uncharacterized protein n=1 Tax=Trametes coccinea (strain BRFM310) TaxID=1353009 RepID=A0A1Y2IB49_TRAC3|nr:hypothetical protein PYCCODRAFT_1427889 [Trametes coccinea BRFM310]
MPSVYEVLGVVLGIIPLLGLTYVYRLLKNRQAPARLEEFATALANTHRLLDELHRCSNSGYEVDSAKLQGLNDALRRIEDESFSARCTAAAHVSKGAFAVLIEFFRHGIICKNAMEIHHWTRRVEGICVQIGDVKAILATSCLHASSIRHAQKVSELEGSQVANPGAGEDASATESGMDDEGPADGIPYDIAEKDQSGAATKMDHESTNSLQIDNAEEQKASRAESGATYEELDGDKAAGEVTGVHLEVNNEGLRRRS